MSNHKIIYLSKNAANEYTKWAVSFFEGCLGEKSCSYCCIMKMRRRFGSYIGCARLHPELINEQKAFEQFKSEVNKNLGKLQKHGLFFSINTDACLPQTIELNHKAILYCDLYDIPTTILTKQTWWFGKFFFPQNTKIGVTLTGCDDAEPGCASNESRIDVLRELKNCNYKTWCSVEPVIKLRESIIMIEKSINYVSHYKIGLLSGKSFNKEELRHLMAQVYILASGKGITIYWKDSLLQQVGIKRTELLPSFYVDKHYDF